MPQLQLPIFPADVTPINQQVAVSCEAGKVVYVHGLLRVWGLRLRRTKQELALSRLFILPSAHYKGVGVRIGSLRS
jgi:hypothetical protein